MKTTYFLTHECPICGKLLRESISYDEVACSDPQCRFNDSHSNKKKREKENEKSVKRAWNVELYRGTNQGGTK